MLSSSSTFFCNGVPYGVRTRVTAVRGRCPRPLDEGDKYVLALSSSDYHMTVDVLYLTHLNNLCEHHILLPFRRSFKEVIQPQVPLWLPCYDFTPVINHTVVIALPCGLS